MGQRIAVVALLAGLTACGDGRSLAEGECYSAQDCSAFEACVRGACVPLTSQECTRDDECGGDRWCDQGACRDREGLTRQADAGSTAPDAALAATCASDSTCGAGNVCETSACVPGCGSLGSAIVCTGANSCNATTGRCETIAAGCMSDTACAPPSEICELGACVPGCAEPGAPSCANGTSCEPSTGRCAAIPPPPPCANDSACFAPAGICEAGACVPGCGQAGGMACGAGSVCNNNSGRCQQLAGPCGSDNDCAAPSTVCESRQCIPGCGSAGGLVCTGSTICNAGTGRCDAVAPPPCANDSACNAPSTVCESGACVAGCASSGCTGGQICSASTGRCEAPPPPPPSCPIDAYEDNDTQATAATGLAAGQTIAMLAACTMDDDFYAFDLAIGDQLRAEVLFSNADGDIDIQILTPSGGVGISGSGIVDNEDVRYTAIAAGRHVLRVALYRDQGTNPGNAYSVRLTHTVAPPPPPPPMCAPDRNEENDTQPTAHVLAVPATENGLTICSMDDDFYAITVQPGEEITARATFTTGEGDIDVALLDAGGTVIDDSTGVSGTEQVVWSAVVPSTVAFRVFLYGDAGTTPGNSYNLSVTTRAVCPDDAFEQNDTQAAQKPIIAGFRNGLSACDLDDDHYRVTLAANQTITVNLAFPHAEGDIDLFLLDSNGISLRSSVSIDDDESVTFAPTSAGNYTIRVRLYGDLGTRPGNFYTMDAVY